MRKDNTQNYQTTNSRIAHFKDFTNNVKRERDDLEKVDRSFTDNEDQVHNLPNLTKYKFNRATRKMDDISRDQVKDRIKSLEDDGVEHTDHVFKIKESRIVGFEAYTGNFNEYDNEFLPKGDQSDPVVFDGDGEEGLETDFEDEVEYDEISDETSYMFFNNLKTIHRNCQEMLEYDENKVNDLLNRGHNWAEDHMSSSKEMVTHVYNFLSNEGVSENIEENFESGNENYMFFGNLENISKMAEEILEMDQEVVDDILMTGHDWAEDHISSAKENIQQVYEWLKTEMK